MDIKKIIHYLDDFLLRTGRESLGPVQANNLLNKVGLLKDNKDRPGKPLRDLLRKNQLPHSYQLGGKGTMWIIPSSSDITYDNLKKDKPSDFEDHLKSFKEDQSILSSINIDRNGILKIIEQARIKYKPDTVRFLLVAEAPPESLDRFFYFEDVSKHDYLFLGVIAALYPDLKEKYMYSGRKREIKKEILQRFQAEGFYLIDLSDMPLNLLIDSLDNQLPSLKEKIENLTNVLSKIILIKVNVYDLAFPYLNKNGFINVIDKRIPFPGQGGQKKFQLEFKNALKEAGY